MNNHQHDPNDMSSHDYDGITELDSLLPRWWLWLFWLCIIFGVIYAIYYHALNLGPLSRKEYEIEMQAAKDAKAAYLAEQARNAPAIDFDKPSKDPAVLKKGETIFATQCFVCHAALGQGLIGPNLTDDFWIHGGTFPEIRHTITEGVPAKGMISWKEKMGPADIHAAASYVWSIHGRDLSKAVPPPKPVEAEAKKYERPPET